MQSPAQFLQELEQEAESTRRVLARVPDEHLGWRPHPRSMTLGQLALHVATTPGEVASMAASSPVSMPSTARPQPSSRAELLTGLDRSLAQARTILEGMRPDQVASMWQVVMNGQPVMSMPVGAVLRTIMLNHWYHHRGQLMVYLRLLEVPLPSVYGPTADENPFAAPAAAMA